MTPTTETERQLSSSLEIAKRNNQILQENNRELMAENDRLRQQLSEANTTLDYYARKHMALPSEVQELRQQLEQAQTKAHEENEWLRAELAREKGTAEYNKSLLQEIDGLRAERDAALARADKISTRLGEIVLEDDQLEAATRAPRGDGGKDS